MSDTEHWPVHTPPPGLEPVEALAWAATPTTGHVFDVALDYGGDVAAAMDACQAAGGGTVFMRAGHYKAKRGPVEPTKRTNAR